MTESELDVLWQRALHEAVAAGEPFTRYRFAALVRAQVLLEVQQPVHDHSTARAGEASTTPALAWLPIETAPKDGTEILVWREDCGPLMAQWSTPEEHLLPGDLERWLAEVGEDAARSAEQADWFAGDSLGGGWRLEGIETPTHWMPLPSDPTGADTARHGSNVQAESASPSVLLIRGEK